MLLRRLAGPPRKGVSSLMRGWRNPSKILKIPARVRLCPTNHPFLMGRGCSGITRIKLLLDRFGFASAFGVLAPQPKRKIGPPKTPKFSGSGFSPARCATALQALYFWRRLACLADELSLLTSFPPLMLLLRDRARRNLVCAVANKIHRSRFAPAPQREQREKLPATQTWWRSPG
jgi:hypothetical protein